MVLSLLDRIRSKVNCFITYYIIYSTRYFFMSDVMAYGISFLNPLYIPN